MTNKTLMIIGALSIIAIIFSSVNSYLLFITPEIETNNEIDEITNRINEIEFKQSIINTQLTERLDNNDSSNNITQNLLSEISILENELIIKTESLSNNITLIKDTLLEDGTKTQSEINELRSTIEDITIILDELNSNLDIISDNISQFDQLLEISTEQTPRDVYESTSKSVVVIRTDTGQGSGFLYSDKSDNVTDLIITNWHVVESASNIEVEFYDRTRSNAKLVGLDAYSDVAVIRVTNVPLDSKPLKLANSTNLYVGQQLVAIGNPLGLIGSLSSGFVSQLNRQIEITDVPIIVPVIQIDLTIAPGSSGGPLLDLSGKVVGITNAGTDAGYNFAIPSNIVNKVAPSLINEGQYSHAIFGFYAIELNPETIRDTNIRNVEFNQTGLMVVEVTPGQPASIAGLTPGIETHDQNGNVEYTAVDIIIAIDNIRIIDWTDWAGYVSEKVSPNQTVKLTILRSSQTISLEITTTVREQFER